MRNQWILLATVVALLAGAAQAGAATTETAKPQPGSAASAEPGTTPAKNPSAPSNKKLVNLNAASKAELKALPGGSDEEAARIIAGRPYNSKALLVTNKVISDGRYAVIKALVVAGEPAKGTAAKK